MDGVDVPAGGFLGQGQHRQVAAGGSGHAGGYGDPESFGDQGHDGLQTAELAESGADSLGAPQPVERQAARLSFRRGDPGFVGQVVDRDLVAAGEPVAGGQDHHQRIGGQVVVGEGPFVPVASQARPVVDQGHVDLAAADSGQGVGCAPLLAQHHRQIGVAAQAAHERPGQGDGHGREGGGDDPAARLVGVVHQVGLGCLDRVEDAGRVLDQAAPGFGEVGRAGGALEQVHTGLLFEGRKLLRDR